ncbi:MAG TPA: hypothetical protein VGB37_08645 [Candidatus Lokiarchaeia archaeon]
MDMQVLDNRHFYLINCLRQIDAENPVDLSTLDKRVEFQKKIYLLKSLGLPLDYSFGSYIKGPYSSSLTQIGFEIYESPKKAIPKKLNSIAPIKKEDLKKIDVLKKLISAIPREKTHAYWLELISSLHFLLTQAYPPVNGIDAARSRLKIWKSNKFLDEDIEIALDLMKKFELIKK